MLRNIFLIDTIVIQLLQDKPATVNYNKVIKRIAVPNNKTCQCGSTNFGASKAFTDTFICRDCGLVYINNNNFVTFINIYKLVPRKISLLNQLVEAMISALMQNKQ